MRLDKAIANNTIYSRKEVSKLIRKNNVSVNGIITNDPSKSIDIDKDEICLFNEVINITKNVYIALNKPSGFVSSNSNKDGESILNLLNDISMKDLHIVGRLDKDTTGLVLITNDGEFTHKIKSPKFEIEKEYEVELEKPLDQSMIKIITGDITLDGIKLKPPKLTNINKNKVNVTITEGKYHQLKRMFKIANNNVTKLKRIRINNLMLNELNIDEGDYTLIDKEDIISY